MRHEFFRSTILSSATLVFLLLLFNGCGGSGSEDPFHGRIDSSYLNKYLLGETSFEKSDDLSAYLDMSGGIYKALKVQSIKEEHQKILREIQARKSYTLWSVGDETVRKVEDIGDLYDPENYKIDYAPMVDAVDSVVNRNENALIVSDFELWTRNGGINSSSNPYAKLFTEWVDAGNRIDIYTSSESFEDGKSNNKKLYFMAFSKKDNSQLLDLMEKANMGMKPLTLNTCAWKIEPKYESASSVGLVHPDLSTPSFFDKDDQERGEKYEVIKLKNNGISGMLASKKEAGQLKLDFIDQLFIDFDASEVFKLKDVKVVVSDISEDYESFCKEIIAKNEGGKIERIKDDKQRWVWDNETRGNAIIRTCFEDNGDSTDLKGEFEYSPKGATMIKEFLEIDSEVVAATKADNPSKVQLRLNLHENFDPKIFENFKLFKVEIQVASVERKSDKADQFIFNDYDGNKNIMLSSGIGNTIKNANEKQTLYTIYLVNTNKYK